MIQRNLKHYNRMKHIDICYNFTRKRVNSKEMSVEYFHTENKLAHIMKKALPKFTFERLRNTLGVNEIK